MELLTQPKPAEVMTYTGATYVVEHCTQFLVKDWTAGINVKIPIVDFPHVRLYHVQAHKIAGRVATCSCEWYRPKTVKAHAQ